MKLSLRVGNKIIKVQILSLFFFLLLHFLFNLVYFNMFCLHSVIQDREVCFSQTNTSLLILDRARKRPDPAGGLLPAGLRRPLEESGGQAVGHVWQGGGVPLSELCHSRLVAPTIARK